MAETGIEVPNLEMEEVPSGETPGVTETPGSDSSQDDAEKQPRLTVPDVEIPTEANELAAELNAQGLGKREVSQLITASRQYAELLRLLEHDPREFVRRIGTYSPQLRDKLVNEASDIFLEVNDPDGRTSDEGQGTGGRGSATDPRVLSAVQRLETRLNKLDSDIAGAAAARQYDTLREAFEGRIKEYVNHKNLESLSGKDKKAVTALLKQSLANDGQATARIQQGNFRDIPRHLQSVLDDWTTDTVAAGEKEGAAREAVVRAGIKSTVAGAINTGGLSENDMSRTPGGEDIWEEAAQDMARDIKKANKRR